MIHNQQNGLFVLWHGLVLQRALARRQLEYWSASGTPMTVGHE